MTGEYVAHFKSHRFPRLSCPDKLEPTFDEDNERPRCRALRWPRDGGGRGGGDRGGDDGDVVMGEMKVEGGIMVEGMQMENMMMEEVGMEEAMVVRW